MRVSDRTVAQLDVPGPDYDRGEVTPGIVHVGVGGFHRAHQAMYVDRLLAGGGAQEWGVMGVGVLPGDVRMRDALVPQDGLYTLVLEHPDGTREPRVVGSLLGFLHAPDDPEAVIELMAAPSTRIISLTITEGGYNLVRETGAFDADEPGVAADLADPAHPSTVFGLVVESLRRRRERGVSAPTVMSCDNVEGNGEVARTAFTTHARLVDDALGEWVAEHVAVPSSMVDRITPVTPASLPGEVAEQFGVEDAWPVVAEPFTQWVLEDRFADGRPPWEDAGVQLVDDVTPYELMKLRLLNASHQGIAYFGHLCGHTYVHEAAQDPLFERFLLAYMEREASPTLPPVPGVDLEEYRRTLIERFANPRIGDTVARLAAESSDRIPTWLVPVIRENLRAGRDVTLSAAIVASWARYAEGVDEAGDPIEVVDRLRDTLVPVARRQREDPTAFVAQRDVFGDLAEHDAFTRPYLDALESLHARGARATLEALTAAP